MQVCIHLIQVCTTLFIWNATVYTFAYLVAFISRDNGYIASTLSRIRVPHSLSCLSLNTPNRLSHLYSEYNAQYSKLFSVYFTGPL